MTNGTQYEPGIWNTAGSGGASQYLHNNHLGTLRQVTDASGNATTLRVFTAFGEPINTPSPADRFGFIGSEGYQATIDPSSGAPAFPYLHLGARYYDPTSGRFLQRDPIGIAGGLNTYAYADGTPTMAIDPSGLWTFGLGLNATGYLCFLPISVSVEISIHIGFSFKDGISGGATASFNGGAGLGAGLGVGVVGTFSNASKVSDLTGTSTEAGIDTPIGGIAVFQGRPSNPDKPGDFVTGGQISVGPGLILGGRAGDTQTAGAAGSVKWW